MKIQTNNIFKILFAITLCSCTQNNSELFLSYQEIPGHFLFAFYPTESCTNLSNQCPNRMLLIAKRELHDENIIYMNEQQKDQQIKLDMLTPIPRVDLKLGMQQAIQLAGYSKGNLSIEKESGSETIIKLELHDSKHARRTVYRYVVKNHKIVGAFPMIVHST